MTRVDAHQHFWNLNIAAYPWLTPDYGPIYANFSPEDLAPQLRAAGIDRTVLVQSANSYEDTAAMLKDAEHHDWIGAVIGWVNLLSRQETEQRIRMYRQNPKFRGIRHLIHNEPDPDWVVQKGVIDSLKVLEDNGILFEVVAVFPNHLKHVPTLVKHLPNLTIVIDHLAKPPIKDRKMHPWAEQLREAAEGANVYAKVSGLNTAADWQTWSAGDLKPYIDHAIDVFGADRLMFGSDWPVCLLAGTYQQVWVETERALEGRPQKEIDAIMGGTAAKVYKV